MKRLQQPLAILACALATWAPAAGAQSLAQLYESARAWDAAYRSARLQYDATLARAQQARAGVLPAVNLQASMSRSQFDLNNPRIDRAYGTQSITLAASHPLYRPANVATWEQAQRQGVLAEAQLLTVEQDLLVRVTQAYFDVLASQDSLAFVQAQKTAVAEQLASAKRNFEVGTATITDTREAQARFDLVLAQEIAAENDLRVKKLALDQLVGRTNVAPKPLAAPIVLAPPAPADAEEWVRQADQFHPGLAQTRVALEVARLESVKARAGLRPTIDASLSYNITRNDNGSTSAALTSRSNLAQVGVTMAWPLFAGYAIENRIKETIALEDKASADVDATQRTVAQATRAAYFGVLSGQGQVKALEAAEASSQVALDANKLGYQVGVRINIDVLNAQSQLFQTKRDLARARYDVLVGSMRLRQAAGTLKYDDLLGIDRMIAP